jgi:hypothetical protein
MIRKKYSDFLLYNLMESVMVSTPEMIQLLKSISNNDIALWLMDKIIYSSDVKTGYNYLGLSPDKNDEITFLPDNQYQRFLSKGDDISKRTPSKISIGRMINQILKDNGISGITDKQIETFVNKFKTAWDRHHGITNRKIQVVSGENIKKWYHEDMQLSGKSTLGNSCMRYDRCQPYLDIYAKNPDKIQLVILTENDKLISRALFWTLDECSRTRYKYYLDRIYVENDSDYEFVQNWADENLGDKNGEDSMASYWRGDVPNMMKVNLKQIEFPAYPYADSMMYIYKRLEEGKITGDGFISSYFSDRDIPDNYIIYEIRDTRGDKDLRYGRYSKTYGKWYKNDEVIYVDSKDDYIPISECRKCEYDDSYLDKSTAIWSESMDSWISKDKSFEDKEFGLVMRGSVVKCVDEYIGGLTNPFDVYKQLESGSNDSYFKFSRKLIKRKNDGVDGYHFIESSIDGLYDIRFNQDLVINDCTGDYQFKHWCISLNQYRIIDRAELRKISEEAVKGICRSTWSSGDFILPLDAKMLGLPETNDKSYMTVSKWSYGFRESNYNELLKLVNSSERLSEEDKKELLKIREWVHNYLLEVNRQYKEKYYSSLVFDSDTKEEFYVKMIHECYLTIMKNSGDDIRNALNERISTANDYVEPTNEVIDILIKLFEGLCGFWFIRNDTYDAAFDLREAIDDTDYYSILDKNAKSYTVREILEDILRYVFLNYRGELKKLISDKIDKSCKEKGVNNYKDIIWDILLTVSYRHYRDGYRKLLLKNNT